MSSAAAQHARAVVGPQLGKARFSDWIDAGDATTIGGAGVIGAVTQYCPWDEEDTAVIIARYTYADWDRLNVTFNPGPGAYGRAITVHCGWTHHLADTPTTMKEFSRLKGYWTATFGGAGDPSTASRTFSAPFDYAILDILKTGSHVIGGKAMMNFMYTEAPFGTVQVDGSKFSFVVEGEFNLFSQE
jgi:hypothetical protein